MAHILTIEDDRAIAVLEKDFLEKRGHTVSVASTGSDGLRQFKGGIVDAVLIDVTLPDMEGFVICRRIRNVSNVPIIFVTARGSEADQIRGLEMGADDYIVKPVNLLVMAVRIEAHVAMHQRLMGTMMSGTSELPDISAGDLQIFVRRHQVFRNKTEIALTVKEFDLLFFLASHPNQVFPKGYLFEKIWHLDACGELATVTVHINRLRDKLNQVAPPFTAIETVWGNGYRFRA